MTALMEFDTLAGVVSARDHEMALALIALLRSEVHQPSEADLVEAVLCDLEWQPC